MNRDAVIARLKSLEPALRDSGIVALYPYGSHARDEARPDSDIDLLVDFERGCGGLAEVVRKPGSPNPRCRSGSYRRAGRAY
jgi:predicted nucleotidyltransferase